MDHIHYPSFDAHVFPTEVTTPGWGTHQQIGYGDAWHWPHWPPFFNSLSGTHWPPFLTRSHLMTPFLIIHNQSLTISHQMTPLFRTCCQHFLFFFLQNFCPKCVQICILPGKIDQNLSNFTVWPPFFKSSHWMTLFWGNISQQKTHSFNLQSEHPSLPKSSAPRSGWQLCALLHKLCLKIGHKIDKVCYPMPPWYINTNT